MGQTWFLSLRLGHRAARGSVASSGLHQRGPADKVLSSAAPRSAWRTTTKSARGRARRRCAGRCGRRRRLRRVRVEADGRDAASGLADLHRALDDASDSDDCDALLRAVSGARAVVSSIRNRRRRSRRARRTSRRARRRSSLAVVRRRATSDAATRGEWRDWHEDEPTRRAPRGGELRRRRSSARRRFLRRLASSRASRLSRRSRLKALLHLHHAHNRSLPPVRPDATPLAL